MTFDEATAACGVGHKVVGVQSVDGEWSYGVLPAAVDGQPIEEFMESYWAAVDREVQRRVSA